MENYTEVESDVLEVFVAEARISRQDFPKEYRKT